MESHRRTIAKTMSWRAIATIITGAIAFVFTGNLNLSLGIGLSDTIIKLMSYYFHERAWNRISYGRGG